VGKGKKGAAAGAPSGKPSSIGGLAEAAVSLDQALRRFEELTSTARRFPLNSQKNIERAARATQEAAESQEAVARQLHALIDAINVARDRNEAASNAIRARAEEIRARTEALTTLMQRFAGLGEAASEINVMVQEALPASSGDSQDTAELSARMAEPLGRVLARMGDVLAQAQELQGEAERADMPELARQTDSVRQQILSARNKVLMLERTIGAQGPRQA
jgi:chromosome segregation ATPase